MYWVIEQKIIMTMQGSYAALNKRCFSEKIEN